MPAKSSSQKHLFSMVKGLKSGALKLSSLPSSLATKVKTIAKSISKKSASDFAKTPAKGLPKHVAEQEFDFPALTFKEYIMVESELMDTFYQLPDYQQREILEACSMEDEEPAVSKKVAEKAAKKGGKKVEFEDEEQSKKDGKKPKWLEKAEVKAEEKEGKKVSKKEEEKVTEKWEHEYKVPESKKGMFSDKSVAELESALAKLKKSGPHTKGSAEYTKEKELNFALRAKRNWKK